MAGRWRWRLVQAGRLIEKKGFATSLRAFAEFASHYPEATLTIAGEGPLQQQLQSQARDLGITNKVFFRGFISQKELRELFYSSHIFLHPSETGADGNQEGVPNSMLEAMASGLPVFATIHGGIPEAIENDRSGVSGCGTGSPCACRRACSSWCNPAIVFQNSRNAVRKRSRKNSTIRSRFDCSKISISKL